MAIFSLAQHLPLWIVTGTLGMVVFVTVVFEHLQHALQHYIDERASDLNAGLFQELVNKLQRELMILGGLLMICSCFH
jgi:hypothetical protein